MKQLMAKHGFSLLDIRPAPQGRVRGLMGLAQITAREHQSRRLADHGAQLAPVDSAYLCVRKT